jgi:hypothetical protein
MHGKNGRVCTACFELFSEMMAKDPATPRSDDKQAKKMQVLKMNGGGGSEREREREREGGDALC